MNETKHISKVAVVTGAGGTLCSEMAKELARKGMKVALLGRNILKLQKVENEIRSNGGTAISISTDVTSPGQVRQAGEIIRGEFGLCSVLINGAGGNQTGAMTTINEFRMEELDKGENDFRGFFGLDMENFLRVVEINTTGTVIPCQVLGEDMARNGGGCIINFASMNSFRPLSRVPAYGIAKSGIANFTQWLAAYLAPANIRVNAIAPGFFLNGRSRGLMYNPDGSYTERGENVIRQTPMKRFGKAPELLGCMNWLMDDEASGFVTGTVIPVDGGFMADSGV